MFHGSMVALVTPMKEDGSIDLETLKRLTEWHIECGTDAILALGTTGESVTLDHKERNDVIRAVIDQVHDRVPVIVGSGTNSTKTTIELTLEAMEHGADAALLVTPYYNKPMQEGLYQHFKAVAEAVPMPQILYNVPSRTSCDLLPETVIRLAVFTNIIGIKEATGKVERVKQILEGSDKNIDLYSGDDKTALDSIFEGGKGVVSVAANVVPRLMHEMCQAALRGNQSEAKRLNDRMAPLYKGLSVETNPIPTKWALHEMKLIPAGIRLPLTWLSKEHDDAVRQSMLQAGVSLTDEAV